MSSNEVIKKAKATSAVVLASIGAGALAPSFAQAKSGCNEKASVSTLIDNIKGNSSFNSQVLESTNPSKSLVVIERKAKNKNHQFEQFGVNPLVIACGSKTVEYAEITGYQRGALGTSYKIGKTKLYLDVIDASEVHIVKTPLSNGTATIKTVELHEEMTHPISGTNIPALLPQMMAVEGANLNNMFGYTNNSLNLPL